jgi:aminoglycoside phosphotransferase (APT) family kinase protein
VDEEGTLCGVIDFGEFQGGPPLHDIAFLGMTCPDADLQWLRRGYGDAEEIWDAAFTERLLLHKVGLQMGILAHYLRQNHAEEAQWAACGLRETLNAGRAL